MQTNEDLSRVRVRIAGHIRAFFELGVRTFHAEDLLEYVEARVNGIAPDSPGRIMRDLRKHGQVSYKVLNRRDSLYQIL